ncbi:MAG: flippase-like domain-containing protein [Alphaproteobacteria bacterium]|nr:flippase-like domain-containing protein [Alphaproteobacteria bacterium]
MKFNFLPAGMNLRVFQVAVGLACTLFFLAVAFYRVQLGAVSAALAGANPVWVAAAMLIYGANLTIRAWRWQVILRPVAAIPYPIVTRALLVGYGLNAVMPARLGELFRAEFFKTTFGLSRIWGLTSIVIERLFDGLTVICCLAIGLLFATAAKPNAGLLIKVLVTGSVLFGAVLLAAFFLSGSKMSRIVGRFPGLSAQLAMVQQGLEILRTWRTLEVVAITLIVYVADALTLWLLVKAVGLTLGFFDTLVLLGAASLSTLVPSGPAFLGTLQFGYALAVEFAGGARALGIAAATLAQLCLLLPLALVAAGILVHGSGTALFAILARGQSDDGQTGQ